MKEREIIRRLIRYIFRHSRLCDCKDHPYIIQLTSFSLLCIELNVFSQLGQYAGAVPQQLRTDFKLIVHSELIALHHTSTVGQV